MAANRSREATLTSRNDTLARFAYYRLPLHDPRGKNGWRPTRDRRGNWLSASLCFGQVPTQRAESTDTVKVTPAPPDSASRNWESLDFGAKVEGERPDTYQPAMQPIESAALVRVTD